MSDTREVHVGSIHLALQSEVGSWESARIIVSTIEAMIAEARHHGTATLPNITDVQTIQRLTLERDELLAELATLRASMGEDAARFDWLESVRTKRGVLWISPCGDEMTFTQVCTFSDYDKYPAVDGGVRNAIDAARNLGREVRREDVG